MWLEFALQCAFMWMWINGCLSPGVCTQYNMREGTGGFKEEVGVVVETEVSPVFPVWWLPKYEVVQLLHWRSSDSGCKWHRLTDLGPWEEKKNRNEQLKTLNRVKSKKKVVEKRSLFCFDKFKYFRVPQQSHRRHFIVESQQWLSFSHSAVTKNCGRGEENTVLQEVT